MAKLGDLLLRGIFSFKQTYFKNFLTYVILIPICDINKKNWQHYYTSDQVHKYPSLATFLLGSPMFCLLPLDMCRTNQGRNCFFIAGQQTDRNTYYFGGLLAVGFNRGEDSFLSVDRQDGAKQPGANTNSLIKKKICL